MPKIITISRDYGSGGRLIAQRVAEKLGIVYYDNEILDLAAKELGVDVDAIREVANQPSSRFAYSFTSDFSTLPFNDQVYTMQSSVIRHLAQHDPCIIVNGCANYVLEDLPHVIRVFIHAPLDSRIKRVEEEYKEEHKDIKKYIHRQDKKRHHYYEYYSTYKWDDFSHFDLAVNSDLGIENIADMIVKAYNGI